MLLKDGSLLVKQIKPIYKQIYGFSWNFSENIQKEKKNFIFHSILNNAISLEMNM